MSIVRLSPAARERSPITIARAVIVGFIARSHHIFFRRFWRAPAPRMDELAHYSDHRLRDLGATRPAPERAELDFSRYPPLGPF